MAKAGFRVVATMRSLERRGRLDEAAAKAGVSERLDIRRLDITEIDSLPALVGEMVRRHGGIDVLVNNAGFPMAGFAEDLRLSEIREQFETNYFGTVALTLAVLPHMRERRSGHVIMVSSISGRTGQPVASAYSSSKFALEGWSEALRLEMRSVGVHVVLIEPGSFQTDIWDRNLRIGEDARGQRSPNYERIQRYAEFVKKKVNKKDPVVVAQLIARVARDPNPRLRYMVGQDAHIQRFLRTILPWNTYERIVRKVSGIG